MTPPIPLGRIDIHSHLLPGVDDGCADLDESLASIATLMQNGYVGSICTPHIWPAAFPDNLPSNIEAWVQTLRQQLADHGVHYRVWPGGEVRLHKHVIDFFKTHGVPTLCGTNRVLCDAWFDKWPRWIDKAFEWLLTKGYQPILAHPERLNVSDGLGDRLTPLTDVGVWLQGNFQSFTGELGYLADRYVRQFMAEGRYTFLAMDMHRPRALPARLDGLQLAVQEFGQETIDEMIEARPRKLILDAS